ncbi:hypothetical protein ACYVVI_00930 [Arenicellales bacterium IMCC57338]|jgi:hypothetical protein
MSVREQLDTLDKVAKVAELAGISGKIDDERMEFMSGFNISETRSQMVNIRPVGKAINEEDVVMIYSPCLIVKKGMLSGISKEQAIELLRQNEGSMFGRFGIWRFKDEDMIVVSSDHMVATLDPAELEMHMLYIAQMADKYEAAHSKGDHF